MKIVVKKVFLKWGGNVGRSPRIEEPRKSSITLSIFHFNQGTPKLT